MKRPYNQHLLEKQGERGKTASKQSIRPINITTNIRIFEENIRNTPESTKHQNNKYNKHSTFIKYN